MNERHDRLEEELAGLRPLDVSANLRPRIAESLAEVAPAKPRRLWWFALAGGLAAACVAALLWWSGGRSVRDDNQPAPSPRRDDFVKQGLPDPTDDAARVVMELRARLDLDEEKMPAFDWPLSERSPVKSSMLFSVE
jgi:ferric-dicitrate binding protein FerR (iron transport regulator)